MGLGTGANPTNPTNIFSVSQTISEAKENIFKNRTLSSLQKELVNLWVCKVSQCVCHCQQLLPWSNNICKNNYRSLSEGSALHANIRLGQKWLEVINTLAYNAGEIITTIKSFKAQALEWKKYSRSDSNNFSTKKVKKLQKNLRRT